jgi:hypothetical protein
MGKISTWRIIPDGRLNVQQVALETTSREKEGGLLTRKDMHQGIQYKH